MSNADDDIPDRGGEPSPAPCTLLSGGPLIERYPEVLPGKQIDPGSDDPPRFALLRREVPVAGGSLDHLLVDQHGVLTLVETKLAENPEARREVVGQMLDYARMPSGNGATAGPGGSRKTTGSAVKATWTT